MLPSVISPQAEFDLLEIGDYIAQDNPRRAESFIDEILEHIEVIAITRSAMPCAQNWPPICVHVRTSDTLYFSQYLQMMFVLSGCCTVQEISRP
jgi:plasmid stabilization system protein ParE